MCPGPPPVRRLLPGPTLPCLPLPALFMLVARPCPARPALPTLSYLFQHELTDLPLILVHTRHAGLLLLVRPVPAWPPAAASAA